MWTLQDRTKSATEVAAEFARTAFEEPRKVRNLKADDGPWFDITSGTFRLVGGSQLYRLRVDRKTYTWTVETQLMT